MTNNTNIFSNNFKDTPFWHDNVAMPTLSIAPLVKTVDVCIIGGGFTGLSTALNLLRGGKSVAVFDAMKLGDGASGKNGGMVGPSLHQLGLSGLTGKYGREKAIDILQEGMNGIEYIQELIKTENIDCDLKMTGRFRGIIKAEGLGAAERECEGLSVLKGFKFKAVEKQDVHSEIGTDIYNAGMIYYQDGGLQPYKLLAGLAKRVLELGGKIYQNAKVGDILKTPNGQKVETTMGSFVASDVVVATNGYSKKFLSKSFSYFPNRVLPVTSAMIATEELPRETIDRMFPNKRMHGGNHRLVQYYRASSDSKRVLYGARGQDTKSRAKINGQYVRNHMCKVFPELENVKIDYSWSGHVAYTFDHAPHLGQQDGIYYAMGYCGSGVTRSVYLGRQLSRRILGLDDYQTHFDNLPFETKPFYTGTPWFMPAVFKWYDLLDRLEGK